MTADSERRRELAERILAQLRPVLPLLVELLGDERTALTTLRKFTAVVEEVDRCRVWAARGWQRRRVRGSRRRL